MANARILLIGDNQDTSLFLAYGLGLHGMDVVTSSEPQETMAYSQEAFDLFLIDANRPQMDVVELCRQLRAEIVNPLLLMAYFRDEPHILEAYQAGVDECIAKPIGVPLLQAKVVSWLRRSWMVPAEALDCLQTGLLRLDPACRHLSFGNGTAVKLTNLEFRLLNLLMGHPNQILPSNLIVDRVWGYSGNGDSILLKTPFLPIILFAILTACVPAESNVVPTSPEAVLVSESVQVEDTAVPPTNTPELRSLITLPISIYIVNDESGSLASTRSEDEIAAIYEKVNDIWAQAGIVIAVQTFQQLTVTDTVMAGIEQGDFRPFFAGIDTEFVIREPSLLNGFYATNIGGANGLVPFGADLFFVMDEPSVHDERVTSHEIGHILGLHHTLIDSDRLMFSGTNGMALTEEEIIVARYVAQGLLDRVR